MKRIMSLLLLTALLLPGLAWGAEEKTLAPEADAPGFAYYTFGTEAAQLVRMSYDGPQVAGDLFLLEDGYLSVGYEMEDDTTYPHPAGKPLTCLNSDLSLRWTLTDPRLDGAWYSELLELPDALVLGSERSELEGGGQAPSVMLIEKDTGAIRWQMEGDRSVAPEERELVWIGDLLADPDGNLLVASNGDLHGEGNVSMIGTLSLLDAKDGSVRWSVSYLEDYGVTNIRDICPLGDGLVLYGLRGTRQDPDQDQIVLYTDRLGAVRGWFAFRPWESDAGRVYLWLHAASEDAVYLSGWETEKVHDPRSAVAENRRSLYMMRLDEETFRNERMW